MLGPVGRSADPVIDLCVQLVAVAVHVHRNLQPIQHMPDPRYLNGCLHAMDLHYVLEYLIPCLTSGSESHFVAGAWLPILGPLGFLALAESAWAVR